MRVALVGPVAVELLNFRRELLLAMVACGHQVLAIAPEDDAGVRASLGLMGIAYSPVPIRRTGTNPLQDVAAILALSRVLRQFRTDAMLATAAKPVIYGSIAGRLAGVRLRAVMMTGVGSVLAGRSSLRRRGLSGLLRILYAVALRQVHVLFFQNPDDEALFRSLRLVGRRNRVVQIHGSGVDLDRFSAEPFPPGPITFLMIGRLIRDKGVAEYFEAARRVRRAHPEVRVQLLGALDSNPSGISSRELEAWRAEGAVEYLGTTPDVRPFLARAHVCVLPSYGEGLPRAVLEAMAIGRAVLTTDVPGCRETVEQGRNGLLVPPRDAGALAEGMLKMLADPARLESMGRESRAIAEERFDVHAVNRVILGAMGLS